MKSGANDEVGTGIKGSAEGKGADKSTEIQQNRWARRAACLPATHRVVVSNRALKARVQRTKLKSGVLLRFRGRRARSPRVCLPCHIILGVHGRFSLGAPACLQENRHLERTARFWTKRPLKKASYHPYTIQIDGGGHDGRRNSPAPRQGGRD